MSTIRDRRKHQNRIEAIAEALDLNYTTTTNAPHALASAGVSSADNATDSEGLSDDHAHMQAKDGSTTQDLDLHQGADGQNLCSRCNEITEIFDFERGIRVRSWRTLDLLALVYSRISPCKYMAEDRVWRIRKNEIDKGCSFCSFLTDCATRMAIHTAFDLEYDDWFLALRLSFLEYRIREANSSYGSDSNLLQLRLFENGDTRTYTFTNLGEDWEDTHVILPVQAYDDRHGEVSDTIDWELIKEWLDTCHAKHGKVFCNDPTPVTVEDIPSFCFIDCEAEAIVPAGGVRHPKYVTLSYIWGASTTPFQVPVASTSLPVLPDSNQRPKVVNDAMEVVQRIGYRYLWVDRYCIPQSDHDAKSIQIKNMGKIYSMSILTIIAAAGNDAEYGLPGVSSCPTLQPMWTTIRSGKREKPVIYFEPPNKDILRSTWNSRGWTYQEALLSRRRLVFTDRHVYFQCESMQSIGSLPSRHPDELLFPADESAVFPFRRYYETSLWREDFIWDLINEYAKRTLSFEQDSIHAVQGILESFRDKCDVFFFYGLPIMDFSYILCDLVDYQNDSTVPNVLTITAGTFWEVDYNIQAIFGSLLWRDNWCNATVATHFTQETMFSDQIELRKMGFPSWTWAGWETAKNKVTFEGERDIAYQLNPAYYVPEGFPFEIRVSYDGKSLAWLRDIEEIQCRSENNSEFPDFLIISGPVFDVRMSCTNAEDQRITGHPTGPVVWKYTSPPFLAYPGVLPYVGPPCSIDGTGGNIMNLIALCVLSDVSEDGLTFRMLILRPVGEDAHGHIYERLTFRKVEVRWCLLGRNSSLENLNLRQMELRIR